MKLFANLEENGTKFPSMCNDDQKMQPARKEEPIVEVPHIDFVFRDQRWTLDDCNQMLKTLHMKCPKVLSRILTKSVPQKKRCVKPASGWMKRLHKVFKPYTEAEVQPTI